MFCLLPAIDDDGHGGWPTVDSDFPHPAFDEDDGLLSHPAGGGNIFHFIDDDDARSRSTVTLVRGHLPIDDDDAPWLRVCVPLVLPQLPICDDGAAGFGLSRLGPNMGTRWNLR